MIAVESRGACGLGAGHCMQVVLLLGEGLQRCTRAMWLCCLAATCHEALPCY